ncbi:MAG: di-heme oxidoredictase family protein, partial [Candidatus Acidiferrales bacterium]
MKLFAGTTLFFLLIVMVVPQSAEAPTGFDNQTNGFVDQATHASDQTAFEAVLQVAEGLGPLYNAQSCRECHQNPTSGGQSQITELRVGHLGPDGHFQNPEIPIADGTEIIKGRSLVNDRAICPNAAFPNTQIQERVPESETVRTFRTSLNLLGDGFVEAIADQTLLDLARSQCKTSKGRICGQALYVPILEAPGQTAVGRFGWKDQHASLLSFAGDAYLNEMGITNKLFPTEVTLLCNTVKEPNDVPGADGFEHIDEFARFIRATEAPAPDA